MEADLVVFPEMAVCGYPPQDLVWESGFVSACEESIDKCASFSSVPLIIGCVRQEKHQLYNSAVLCENGEILFVYDKILLPTYDVFDEARYFSKGNNTKIPKININGVEKKIGIQICEDVWDEKYDVKVTDEMVENGAEVIINISASPFHDSQLEERQKTIKQKINKCNVPFVYCNMVGGQDELIFDGNSFAYNHCGDLVNIAKAFEEDLIIIDTGSKIEKKNRNYCREETLYFALCLGVRDYFFKTGHKKSVLGLSGGIDSSLTACIAVDSLGKDNVMGVAMPSEFSSEHSKTDALQLAQNLGLSIETIEIKNMVNESLKCLSPLFKDSPSNVAEENIQARIRGLVLMAISNKFNWLVLTTGNKTELALGYCTLYGDMSGGLAAISDLSKQDVYAISRWVNDSAGFERIPENSLEKPPSAELSPNQVDPFDYDIVSPMVESIIQEKLSVNRLVEIGSDRSVVSDIEKRIRINEYKRRQAAPGLRVTSKAFGVGRRYPIVNHFKPQ